MKFNSEKLRGDIITKRVIKNKQSMDEAAKEIGISKPTLSRLEQGKLPDIITFGKVVLWLRSVHAEYFNPNKNNIYK